MPKVTGGRGGVESGPSGNRSWIGVEGKIYQEAMTQGQIVLISEGHSVESRLDDKWPVCVCVWEIGCYIIFTYHRVRPILEFALDTHLLP